MNKEHVDAQTFMQQLGVQHILNMFDLLPDIIFWIKDRDSRLMYVNQPFVENVGRKSASQLIGKTDYDCAPKHIAQQFITDDKRVMNGELVTKRLELNLDISGGISWYSTSKRPICNSMGEIIGSYGITHRLEKTADTLSDVENLSAPIKYIRQNFHREIKIKELADIAHLSISALERRFKKYLSKTPKQFINHLRLEHSRKLLIETNMPISEVAFQSGFAEPSYFSRQFKQLFNELPSDVRTHLGIPGAR